jgi:hypothetical protein
MKPVKHWQDPVNAVLGVWLIVSPWALGFQAETVAMASAVVLGVALLAASLGAIFVPKAWEEWTELAIGVLVVASPWAMRFSAIEAAMLSMVITGIVTAALALWTLATDKDFSAWSRSDRVAH